MLLKRFPVPRNFGMAPNRALRRADMASPRPPNLHLIEVDDGREAGAGMMIIEKMLPRALGRKLPVDSIEGNLDSLGAELELEKMIAV
jgi:hypothetical protein